MNAERDLRGRFTPGNTVAGRPRRAAQYSCPDNSITRLRILLDFIQQRDMHLLTRLELVMQLAHKRGAAVSLQHSLNELATLTGQITLDAYRLLAKELKQQLTEPVIQTTNTPT